MQVAWAGGLGGWRVRTRGQWRAVADLTVAKRILREAAEGNRVSYDPQPTTTETCSHHGTNTNPRTNAGAGRQTVA